jgi:hypothetical protein
MNPLSTELRNKLERTIVEARGVAEAGAKAALEAIAVHHHEPYGHMSPEERMLRNHLRARARQLGDKQNRKGEMDLTHLMRECAYEHWHRMLFARFLAENDLLIELETGVAISLEECEELAKEDGKDLWTLASEFAQSMLPQIFRPNDPVLNVNLAREHRLKLENLLNGLEPAIFTASNSLGWVYQFWQGKRKKEVNASGNKIGADELPAVTQLFTEPYMVSFLLDNSLGAWWAGKRLNEEGGRLKEEWEKCQTEADCRRLMALPSVPLEYLRLVKQENGTWTPATGTFDGWPERLSELKILDPCCGSGHFLVAAFLMLVAMRMELDRLSTREAVDAVLCENLHGLEIDNRCVELAAFALALTAWRYPGAGGYRQLPELNVACSGLSINAKKGDWLTLVGNDGSLSFHIDQLYNLFKDAQTLGSLINPRHMLREYSLFSQDWKSIEPVLDSALTQEMSDEKVEMGVAAKGMLKAVKLLAGNYALIVTNVPYLARGKQSESLKNFIGLYYNDSRQDLATAFLDRSLELAQKSGTLGIVCPQNWLSLPAYSALRKRILKSFRFDALIKLGPGAFGTISGEVVNVALLIITSDLPSAEHKYGGVDLASTGEIQKKAEGLAINEWQTVLQKDALNGPDSRITLEAHGSVKTLGGYANSPQGIKTGDDGCFRRNWWELPTFDERWRPFQGTPESNGFVGGMRYAIDWAENGRNFARLQGTTAWGKHGVVVKLMGDLTFSLYSGAYFDSNVTAIIPHKKTILQAIWTFCLSPEFKEELNVIEDGIKVNNATVVKVPFDLDYWTKVAEEKYPNGLPQLYSDDPTQWIFHGHPAQSDYPLQVAVTRVLGCRWPVELDPKMELADEQREWVNECEELLKYTDEDGIVCIPSVRGEETADSRLRILLVAAFGPDWSPLVEQELIKATGANAYNLDEWLRDHFFEQHCNLFHHRPFIWHIWDGRRRDGFHALVNYHKLAEGNGKGRRLLENLTYSYLGEWITRQREGVKRGEGGAEDRLAAALELQKRLIAIIEGEPPFDIFLRWKPIEDQPIGWEPDINDGVRLNIRPFLAQDIPGGRKGAGILRWKPNIDWKKDRGKEPFRPKEQYPWLWKDGEFTGDRVNDIHLNINDKQKARKEKKQT